MLPISISLKFGPKINTTYVICGEKIDSFQSFLLLPSPRLLMIDPFLKCLNVIEHNALYAIILHTMILLGIFRKCNTPIGRKGDEGTEMISIAVCWPGKEALEVEGGDNTMFYNGK